MKLLENSGKSGQVGSNGKEETMKKSPKFKFGVLMAVITLFAIASQPIISGKRPAILDPVIFALATNLFENLIILPFAIKDTIYNRKSNPYFIKETIRKYWWRFLIIGSVFAVSLIMFFYGFDISGAISGSIVMKSDIIFTLIIGWIFLREKASVLQIIFTGIILLILVYTFTSGTFQIDQINIGTVILFIMPLLWTIGNSVAKPLLKDGIITPSQIIYIRTLISTILLCIFYFLIFPMSNIMLFVNWKNLLFMFLIGFSYTLGHIGWYTSIKHIDLAISSAITAPQPIVTSIFAWLILSEPIEIYHYIGLAVIFVSILIILMDKNYKSRHKE